MERGLIHLVVLTLLILFFGAFPVDAATFEPIQLPGSDVFQILMSGEIVPEDSDTFVKLIEGHQKVSIALSGPGGNFRESLTIGSIIREKSYATQVLPDSECDSACALIWVSGARRYISPTSRIGFHAVSKTESGKRVETGEGNAELGAYLNALGLRIEAIRFFTRKGPEDVSYLTPEKARQLGIETLRLDLDYNNPAEIPIPKTIPTVDNLIERFDMYVLLRNCPISFEIDQEAVNVAIGKTKDEGVSLVGEEQWAELLVNRIGALKLSLSGKSPFWRCIRAISFLNQWEQTTGISHPSFDCSSKLDENEKYICHDAALQAYDLAVAELYKTALLTDDAGIRVKVKQTQVRWLKDRRSCGSDKHCIVEIYRARLRPMMN